MRANFKQREVEKVTCIEVSIGEWLQDAVHGSHVEQKTKLSHRHGH